MNLKRIADQVMPRPDNVREVRFDQGDTKDIIQVILYANQFIGPHTKELSRYFKKRNDYQSCRKIWQFVKKNIRYRKDADGFENVKSPAKTWFDKYGDCKSMSLLIGSLLKNLAP